MFKHFSLNAKQKQVIQTCRSQSQGDWDGWYRRNLWQPIVFFVLSIGLSFLFNILADVLKSIGEISLSLIFNGTLTFIGINAIFSTKGLINNKDIAGHELDKLRVEIKSILEDNGQTLLFVGSAIYAAQTVLTLKNFGFWLDALMFLVISALLYWSIDLSSKTFIAGDYYFNLAYGIDDDIADNVKNHKTALDDLL